jgi:hypothetical protein
MTEDELTRRLSETLRAKAAQIPEPEGAVVPATEATSPGRARAWRSGLLAAAAVVVLAGLTAVVVALRSSDEPDRPAAPATTTTTTEAQTTTTTTGRTGGKQSFVWTGVVTRPDGTVVIGDFNTLLEMGPPWGDDPVQIVEHFTKLDPASPRPETRVTVDDVTRTGDTTRVLIRTSLADDSVAFVRFDVHLRLDASGAWRLDHATWAQQCRPNRGHQDFSVELCL